MAKTNSSPRELRGLERRLIDLPNTGDIRVTLAYPNDYWVAMSNLGFQTVYRLFAETPRVTVDRAFVPGNEDKNGRGRRDDVWRTFENSRVLPDCEIFAMSVSFETDYVNVISFLDRVGVPLDRSEARDPALPLILGGGAAITLNPEPLARFFDAIVLGEAEEVLGEIMSVYTKMRDARQSRAELLQALSQIEGVYVPSLYTVTFNDDDTIHGMSVTPPAPEKIVRRYVRDLDAFPTTTVIETPETEFKQMFMTETGRGCEVGCRFCVSGYMYRPIRKRSGAAVRASLRLAEEGAGSAVGFVGAAVSSHPEIASLAAEVAGKGKRASLSSIMSQRVTGELAKSLNESEYKTVALAPEAGSETLRFRVGKRVLDEQVLSGVETLAEAGIRSFKLYFMVGLPGETTEDVKAIAQLSAEAQRRAYSAAVSRGKRKISTTLFLSVNPFIPKAWTPFQRHPFLTEQELKARLKLVTEGIKNIPNVEMKYESPRESYFQTVMSRGDRRVADLLVWLYREGVDWRTVIRRGRDVVVDTVPAPDFYVYRTLGADELLPWEHVDMHIKRSLLEREYKRAFDEDVKPLIARAKRLRMAEQDQSLSGCGGT